MAKATTCKEALERFEREKGVKASEATAVELCGLCPPVEKMDASLGALRACTRLSLSTNNIEKIGPLAGLDALQVLSLGRNCLKKVEGLEAVGPALRELWVSYNLIEKLAGIERCSGLRVLYASNNRLRDWAEVDRLAAAAGGSLEDVLLAGNPLAGEAGYRAEVLRRLPRLKKLDGVLVEEEEREAALRGAA